MLSVAFFLAQVFVAGIPWASAQEATPPPSGVPARLTLPGRDTFPADVVGLEDGLWEIESEWLRGRAAVRMDAVVRLQFESNGELPKSKDAVVLTNDDLLTGKVERLDEDAVVLASAAFGRLSLPRRYVRSVRLGGTGDSVRRADFYTGDLGEWKAPHEKWFVQGGVLWNFGTLATEIDPAEPFLIELELFPRGRQDPRFELTMLGLRESHTVRDEGRLLVQCRPGRLEIATTTEGRGWQSAAMIPTPAEMKGRESLRIAVAVRPAGGQATVWVDGKEVLSGTGVSHNKDGRFVLLSTYDGIRSASILTGEAEIDRWKGEGAPAERDAVVLANGERFEADAVTVADDGCVVTTADVEMELPRERMREVLLRTDDREDVPEPPGACVLQAGASRLTLAPVAMSDGRLVGRTGWADSVSVRPGTMQSLHHFVKDLPEGPCEAMLRLPDDWHAPIHVVGIADGAVVFEAPWLKGSARAELAALSAVTFEVADAAVPDAAAVATNGDTFTGNLVELTGDALAMDAPALGRIRLPASALARLYYPGHAGALIRPDFRTGLLAPLKQAQGSDVEVRDGLVGFEGFALLTMEFPQDKPFTVHIAAHKAGQLPAQFRASLFGRTQANSGEGVMSLELNADTKVRRIRCRVQTGATALETVINHETGFVDDGADPDCVLTLAVDPVGKKLSAWMNDEKVADMVDLPKHNEDGRFLTLVPFGCRLSDVAVRFGLAEPDDFALPTPRPDAHVLNLADGTAREARSLRLVDGAFVATTADGEERIEPSDVSGVLFATESHEEPEALQGAVRVTTSNDRLTMTVEELDGTALIGHSALLGEVRVLRDALKTIEALP